MRRRTRLSGSLIAVVHLACVAASGRARAATPVAAQVWHLPHAPAAIAQDGDGFVWAATRGGLVRFDGEGFRAMPAPSAPWGHTVTALAPTKDGAVWAGLRATAGLLRARGDVVTFVPEPALLPGEAVRAIVEGAPGELWIGTDVGLLAGPPGKASRLDASLGVPPGMVDAVGVDDAGVVWVVVDGALLRREAGGRFARAPADAVPPARLARVGDGVAPASLAEAAARALGADPASDEWWPRELPRAALACVTVDREGGVWLGARTGVVARLERARVRVLGARDGLPGDAPFAVLRARDGAMWATGSAGLARFARDGKVTHWTAPELPTWCARSLAETTDGAIWVATCDAGVVRLLFDARTGAARFSRFAANEGVAHRNVLALRAGRSGALWAGPEDGGLLAWHDERFERVEAPLARCPGPNALGVPCASTVVGVLEDRAGDLWIATRGEGLLRGRGSPRAWRRWTAADGVPGTRIEALEQDGAGTIWLASQNGGVARLDPSGRFVAIGAREGLPRDTVTAIADDGRGSLWLATDAGVVRVLGDDLRRAGATARLDGAVTYDVADGMSANECIGSFKPALAFDAAGALWVTTVLGASVIAPAVRQPARAPAALRIAAVVANGAPVAMEGARATIPPGRRDLELRWALPAFASSRHVRFRYRLVGQDAAWLDAGARRAAFYTNLAPGAYAFEVRATHEEAGWTTAATLVTLELAPHLHERAAFRFGLAACALAAVALALRARRRGERARFAAILDERNRIARDMHDSLAQSFTALTLHLGRIDKKLPDVAPDVRTLVADARQMVSHCRREVRQAVFDLRHEGTELRAALETLATQAARASEEVAVRVVVEGEPRALPGAIEREVLYVAQEALSNALAHARACEVELRLRYADGAVELDVRDDGVGLPARAGSAGGFGLLGMRERARRVGGSLDFTSAPGQGTIVRMRVPS